MGERLRSTATRQPGRAVGVLAAVAVLGTALAAGWTERLALSSDATRQAPLEIQATGELDAESAAFRVAVGTMRSQLTANRAVAGVRERRPVGNRRSTVLVVHFEVGGRRRDAAIRRIERNLDPGPLALSFRGAAAAARGAKDAVIDDLYLLLLALPLVALLAVVMLGLRAAGAALLAAAAAAAAAALLSELLAGAFDVSWLALVGAAGGGLVTLQLCAMARTGAGSTAICAAGLAGAMPFAAIALLGVDYLAGLGLGGALGALFAAPASLLAAGAVGEGEHRGAGIWWSVGDLLGWSSLLAILVGALALALLAFAIAPVDGLTLAALGAAAAPEIDTLHLGAAVGVASLASGAIAGFCGERLVLAIGGALVFALPAVAVAGLLVASIQRGWLEGPLEYASSGTLQLGSVAAAVTLVASVCACQLVTLAAAARRADAPEEPARVGEAMALAGPPMTLTCVSGIVGGIALAFSSELSVKQFGLGIAAGMALELAVVGLLLAAGLLRLSPARAARQ